MNLKINYLTLICAIIGGGCSDATDNTRTHDPNTPVGLTDFYPNEGNISTKFIIEGTNFGSNPEKIAVYFNEKRAHVMSSTGNTIYCLVPRQPGDECSISVKIGDDSVGFADRTFSYNTTENVSDVAGIPNNYGYEDGDLLASKFNNPRFLAINKYGELLVTEPNFSRVRVVSETDGSVTTLSQSIKSPIVPGFSPDKSTIYIVENSWGISTANVMVVSENTGWKVRKFIDLRQGPFKDQISYMNSALADNSGNVYVTISETQLICINLESGQQTLLNAPGSFICYNPVDNKLYGTDSKVLNRMNLDGSELETVAGGAAGYADGLGLDAQFNTLQQICTDVDGNIIMADADNNCIRKYDIQTKMVSTVAGSTTAGYKNGLPKDALFWHPVGVTVDENNVIYVSDEWNHIIRKIAIE